MGAEMDRRRKAADALLLFNAPAPRGATVVELEQLADAFRNTKAEALEWAADYCDGNCHAPDCEGGDRRDLCPPCKMADRLREEAQRIREGR